MHCWAKQCFVNANSVKCLENGKKKKINQMIGIMQQHCFLQPLQRHTSCSVFCDNDQ